MMTLAGNGSMLLSLIPPEQYLTIPLMPAKQAQETIFQIAPSVSLVITSKLALFRIADGYFWLSYLCWSS